MDASFLTPRQRQCVRLKTLGCSLEEISRILNLSVGTVDNHVWRAMKRLGITKNAILVRYAVESGLSPLGDWLTDDEQQRLRNRATVQL